MSFLKVFDNRIAVPKGRKGSPMLPGAVLCRDSWSCRTVTSEPMATLRASTNALPCSRNGGDTSNTFIFWKPTRGRWHYLTSQTKKMKIQKSQDYPANPWLTWPGNCIESKITFCQPKKHSNSVENCCEFTWAWQLPGSKISSYWENAPENGSFAILFSTFRSKEKT